MDGHMNGITDIGDCGNSGIDELFFGLVLNFNTGCFTPLDPSGEFDPLFKWLHLLPPLSDSPFPPHADNYIIQLWHLSLPLTILYLCSIPVRATAHPRTPPLTNGLRATRSD